MFPAHRFAVDSQWCDLHRLLCILRDCCHLVNLGQCREVHWQRRLQIMQLFVRIAIYPGCCHIHRRRSLLGKWNKLGSHRYRPNVSRSQCFPMQLSIQLCCSVSVPGGNVGSVGSVCIIVGDGLYRADWDFNIAAIFITAINGDSSSKFPAN